MASSFERMWQDLLPVGRSRATGGYRRFAWTRADAELRDWFTAAAQERGLAVDVDRAGNQWAWLGDPDADGPGVVVGSHLDSVPDGGAFDGPLGVVSAFAALDSLRDSGSAPARPLGVVNFADEEGARFGVACAGSRLLTGALDPDRARALRDGDGVTLAEAMAAAGHDPQRLGRDDGVLGRIHTFVELHIEQGRALGPLGREVGVGAAIWPHGRWRADLPGRADHAGTTALNDRDDPMLALAGVIGVAREAARRHDGLATCGKVRVVPNGVNAIPSEVSVWLDARGRAAEPVRAIVAEVERRVRTAGGTLHAESWTDRTAFDGELADRLCGLLQDAPLMETGAGHDAGVLAAAGIRTAMLFVRNPTGVSHSPHEHAEDEDCRAGVRALTAVLAELVS